MLWSLSLSLLAAVAFAKEPFIVGGQDTTIEKYPSLVQVEYFRELVNNWEQECGASILTRFWVLSAAHCFVGELYKRENTRIRAGATLRQTGGSVHYVDYERNHPDYKMTSNDNADITVVKLLTPLVYSPTIQQGTIVTQNFVVPDNFPVVHAGWGTTQFGGSYSEILQDVTVYVVNRDACEQRYGRGVITENMICAGVLGEGGRDACQGDSGGPLYAGQVIVGVTSFGRDCGHPLFPGVSTSVASYSDWIIANAR